MSSYPHPIIAREGWPFLALAVVVAVALSISPLWPLAVPAWLVVLFIAQFFRDPPRAIPQEANAVLSPADGKIVAVGNARDPYLDREALKISVFMNVFNVHSNRSPVDGDVKNVWYNAGRFVNAALDKASLEDNERNATAASHAGWRSTSPACRSPGLIARRILCYVESGRRVSSAAQRYGFIRFGSRVDVYLPSGATPRAAVGDSVYATESILAVLGLLLIRLSRHG